MQKLTWTDDLNGGIKIIDKQHKGYFKIVNSILDMTLANQHSEKKMREAFKFLRIYVIDHFATEEKLMTKHDYPMYGDHKRRHMYFRKKLASLYESSHRTKNSRELAKQMQFFLVDWFLNHIKTSDKKMSLFVKKEINKYYAQHPIKFLFKSIFGG